jgi:AraC-like DNA-binding protein
MVSVSQQKTDFYTIKHAHFLPEGKNVESIFLEESIYLEERKEELLKLEAEVYFYLFLALFVVAFFLAFYLIYIRKRSEKNIQQLSERIAELQAKISKKNEPSQKSTLSDKNALKLIEKLKNLEKEELFLQPNYTLNEVAKKLKTNSSYLSETVNKYLDVTFVEYSNRLRIKSILKRLEKQKHLRNYTIDALAHESGYKSVTSFNYHFKKMLKVPPSQYLEQLK